MWDKTNKQEIRILKGHFSDVNTITVDDRYIYSGGSDDTVRVWDKETGKLLRTLKGHTQAVNVVVVDDRYIYSGSWDDTVRVWDKETGELVRIFDEHGSTVLSLAVDGQYLYVGEGFARGKILDKITGELVYTFKRIIMLSLEVNGQYVYSGCVDGTVRIWKRGMTGKSCHWTLVGVLRGLCGAGLLLELVAHTSQVAFARLHGINSTSRTVYDVVAVLRLPSKTENSEHAAKDGAIEEQLRAEALQWFFSADVLRRFGLLECDWKEVFRIATVRPPKQRERGFIEVEVDWAVYWTPYGLLHLETAPEGKKVAAQLLSEWRQQREKAAQLLRLKLPSKVREAKSFRELLEA